MATDISWSPANPAPGDLVTFSAVVTNEGCAALPPNTWLVVSFSLDGTFINFTWDPSYSLGTGASVTLTVNGTNPARA